MAMRKILKSIPRSKAWKFYVGVIFAVLLGINLLQTFWSIIHHHRGPRKNRSRGREYENTDKDFDIYNASRFSNNSMHASNSIRIHYYNKMSWLTTKVFDKCEYKCHLTWGRKRYKEADFLIFFGPRLNANKAPPKPLGQTWIYHAKESMANYRPLDKSWRFRFNWTMTMRRDSDSCAYNGFVKTVNGEFNVEKLKETWKKKTKGTAWFVSNCNDPCRRKEFVDVLRKHMEVDIYGPCGKYKCPRTNESKCFDILKQRYKIYLAFENSLCRDYITEKGFNMYDKELDVVPVVRGVPRSHYDIYFPPNSYIATEDFPSIEELSKYLKKVTENFDIFSQYMRYRQFYKGYFSFPLEFCNICERAHKAYKYKGIYEDMNVFERGGSGMIICRNATDLPNKTL